MVTYLARSAWTSTSPGGSTLPASDVDEVDVHYPGSGNVELAGLSPADVARRLRGWRDGHVNDRGWSDIGYNMAVDGSGRVWWLRGLGRVGAHAASDDNPNQNRHSIGVLFVLGNVEHPTTAQLVAFRDLRSMILKRSPEATLVRGHGQVPGASTSCPGASLRALIADGVLSRNPETKDWFDMATQNDLIVAMRKVLDEGTITSPNGDTKAPKWSIRHLLDWAGRAIYGINGRLAKTEVKADAILKAVREIPGVDGVKLAADVAAAVERIDADAIVDELSERLTDGA